MGDSGVRDRHEMTVAHLGSLGRLPSCLLQPAKSVCTVIVPLWQILYYSDLCGPGIYVCLYGKQMFLVPLALDCHVGGRISLNDKSTTSR